MEQPKWEYAVLAMQGDVGGGLNKIHEDGWEPVCYLGTQADQNGVNQMLFVVKRVASPIIKPTEQERKLVLTK